jgi:DnaA family protein
VQQLLLQLASPPAPTLANFAPGRNAEPLAALSQWVEGRLPQPSLYLWGVPGSGKTHLLAAAIHAVRARGARGALVPAEDTLTDATVGTAGRFLAIDDVDRLDAGGQAALFSLLIREPAERAHLLLSGANAPAALPVREDVRTRIAAGLVLQVEALSDQAKVLALRAHARDRGFDLPEDAAQYLLRHVRRDLPSLMAVLDAADQYSLQLKRPVTSALLRELLQTPG